MPKMRIIDIEHLRTVNYHAALPCRGSRVLSYTRTRVHAYTLACACAAGAATSSSSSGLRAIVVVVVVLLDPCVRLPDARTQNIVFNSQHCPHSAHTGDDRIRPGPLFSSGAHVRGPITVCSIWRTRNGDGDGH